MSEREGSEIESRYGMVWYGTNIEARGENFDYIWEEERISFSGPLSGE